jgi:NAD(P)H-dependent nitrite reductase small subunit
MPHDPNPPEDEYFDEDSIEDALAALNSEISADEPRARAFVYACKLSEIPQNGSRGKVIFCEHDEVALFLLKGTVYAISNICPHQSSPLLSEGRVDKEELSVECPMHGWIYRLDTGRALIGSGSVPTYAVRVVDGEVWIEEPPQPIIEISLN